MFLSGKSSLTFLAKLMALITPKQCPIGFNKETIRYSITLINYATTAERVKPRGFIILINVSTFGFTVHDSILAIEE